MNSAAVCRVHALCANGDDRVVDLNPPRAARNASPMEGAGRFDSKAGAMNFLRNAGEHPRYRIVVASDRATRERAYALAHRVYQRKGYVTGENSLCVSPHDASGHTLTLLAQDGDGNDCATISLVFDSRDPGLGLPCDEIYRNEVDSLRRAGRRLAEITRLAIDDHCRGAKDLLLKLFDRCYIFARFSRQQTDLLIEVNPRHATYYQRQMRFTQVGPQRACSRVQGAPAVLLRMNFADWDAAFDAGSKDGRDVRGRRLHPYPYSPAEESAIALSIALEHRPMSVQDAIHFKLMHLPSHHEPERRHEAGFH